MLTFLSLFAVLGLVAASPLVPKGSKLLARDTQRINWRGAGNLDYNKLSVCSSGPMLGTRQNNMYCNIAFVVNSQFFGVEGSSSNGTVPKYCIDATTSPANGAEPHAWKCIDGAWQQDWVFRPDGRIELAGRGLCLDVTDGDRSKNVQLWACDAGNSNQLFDLGPYPGDYGTAPTDNSTAFWAQ
ncbi:hypothetical protein CspeluHIS016_0900400 [Cutaneotrichosporon spelunceum]|uniref:Ricin B lectin domain-containing protein n=1 Tax=Cutaneotrichosporon spelunceum TaxID=1672016 RepID=A0AAD3TZV2_9TREE|nr:hypothetical protein CspeluHIS016_0900400 [Cutaneotrichosporon spelunceum]